MIILSRSQSYEIFPNSDILIYFCQHVRSISDFQEVYKRFVKCFTARSVDFLFVKCEPTIIKFIFDNNLPFGKQALFSAVSNGHMTTVQRIHAKYQYTKSVWSKAMLMATERNNNRVQVDRYWTAKLVDAFAAHGNLPVIEMIFNKMDGLFFESVYLNKHIICTICYNN
ncbi:hypothetical protein PPL_06430 [Heterostelium album PN500]|uniref:Ankyrin repeat protein n=1 Tax=Heterostelium pallidum (strain ATCC 26659 / Pp 5 / PN500) TaxID=670386 RepID=D3BD50_HETP5|nr:hypothetical protein PPL_06430 [Heterostelium album PN500]EFA80842.1 hypothetical protein PPL_06430 [Heterostelium album PN500]|eukprot:XP_020432961.1 hypothetical protein PPL_06430 [Heterostelium album PN500]